MGCSGSRGNAARVDGPLNLLGAGIGAAICRHLAGKGCSIVLNYSSDSSTAMASELASELESTHGVRARAVQADMGSPTGPELVVSTAKDHFSHPDTGAFQVDVVINNAGVAGFTLVEEIKVEGFQKVYAVNVLGPLLLMKAVVPYLPKNRSGRVVNVSSISATIGTVGSSVYGGSKAALDAMTRCWSTELAERATVNSINPGPVSTDMFDGALPSIGKALGPLIQLAPLMAPREGIDTPEAIKAAEVLGGRAAYPEEIADIVGMLCSRESGWCTGSVVNATGGMLK